MDSIYELLGHAGFALTATAYLMTDFVRLRMIALVSIVAGIAYNATLPTGPLWLVITWLGVLAAINVFFLVRAMRDRIAAPLSEAEREVLANAFPRLHSRDWARLRDTARERTRYRNEVLLELGAQTDALHLLLHGRTWEQHEATSHLRRAGAFWGEVSFCTGHVAEASPCRIRVTSERAIVLSWSFEELRALCKRYPRLREGLYDGFMRAAAVRAGMPCATVEPAPRVVGAALSLAS